MSCLLSRWARLVAKTNGKLCTAPEDSRWFALGSSAAGEKSFLLIGKNQQKRAKK
jgi:hypothetical protein